MSQQGERPTGQQDDWWGQLYDDSTGDTGPAPAPDSLDDRFASATDTLTPPTPPPAVPPPRASDVQPGEPRQERGARSTEPRQGRGELRGEPSRPAPGMPSADGSVGPSAASGAGPGEGRGAQSTEPRQGRGELRGEPSRPAPGMSPADGPVGPSAASGAGPGEGRGAQSAGPRQGGGELRDQPPPPAPGTRPAEKMPPPWWPPSTPLAETRRAAPTDPRHPVPTDPPPAEGPAESDPLWRSGLQRQRAPWEAPPAEPPGPATFQQGQGGPTGFRTPVPPPTAMSTEVPPPASEAAGPGKRPATPPSSEWPQPPGGPPTIGPPPTVGTPSLGDSTPTGTPPDQPEKPEQSGESGESGRAEQPVLRVPETPAPLDHVGSGPPTYDAEPTALPAADPDDLDDLVADTVLDGASYGTYTLRAVSVRGDSARFRGEPRRDSLLTARFGTGDDALVLVAMATGARATPDAHRAAAEACQWIGRAVGRSHARLAEDIRAARRGDLKSGLHRLTDRSLGRLRAAAVERGVEPEEYTASLRCLLLPADPACRTRVFFGVGAGGLFRLRDGEWQDIEPRVADTTGEAVVGFGSLPPDTPGETPRDTPHETPDGDRLTMDLGITTPPSPYEPAPEPPPRAPFRFRASVARPGDTLLLCSGGLAEPLRGEPRLVEHLTSRWSRSEPPGLAAFLADSTVRVKGYADDRTAAAVWEA
ncbi:protein phosphatase 2C domain-containing protein [Streptomyces tauricus]|uniref:protein phosphatase 2C domain-containing protein n=1 Tax=Streptomyces tauricus TaxID=68274 RepID=UPI00387F328F